MNSGLNFGIYAAGRAGRFISYADDPSQIDRLVGLLSGGRPFVVREYIHYLGRRPDADRVDTIGAAHELDGLTMPDSWYASEGRQLDLVLSYLPTDVDIDGWLTFIDRVIERYGSLVRYLQITLEPNFPIPWIDGSSPGVVAALTEGLPHARMALDRGAHHDVELGFSLAEPAEWLGGDDAFWAELARRVSDRFLDDLGYVGLALYPDAFWDLPPAGSPNDAGWLSRNAVRLLREKRLPQVGIAPSVPIHIAESGSPTRPGRSPQAQAESIEAIVRAVASTVDDCNVSHYELFALRDANSSATEPVTRFGLTTDRYQDKPAFEAYRRLIAEFGSAD